MALKDKKEYVLTRESIEDVTKALDGVAGISVYSLSSEQGNREREISELEYSPSTRIQMKPGDRETIVGRLRLNGIRLTLVDELGKIIEDYDRPLIGEEIDNRYRY